MSTWAVRGYTEERELGRGASGRVVAAVSQATGERVAIKYLSDKLVGDPQFMAQFRYEADLQRSLDVPHIVQLLDYVEAPGQGAAIVMELVNGVSLHQMIVQRGPASPEAALTVLKGSLLGLAAAHAAGIVHRDYKPENVLVDAMGDSKLADFGVAVHAGRNMSVAGTPLYMAPEQWSGAPNSPATDIYAATAVFFECLTGKTPFTGRIPQLRRQHETASVPLETVDIPLRAMIARGMAKDPAQRPRNAIDFILELESTASAAYGPDWEERGRGQLAARVAALLLLLWPHGSTPGSSGTSETTYFAGGGAAAPPPPARPVRRRRRGPARRKTLTVAAVAAVAVIAVAAAATAVTLSSRHSKTPVDPAAQATSSATSNVSPSAPVLAAQATVTPPVAASPCTTPTTFTFQGTITAQAGDTVSYQWVYSSGSSDPVRQLHFTADGQQQQVAGGTVTTKTAGAGWAELKLTGPGANKTSNQAAYQLLCTTPNSGITTTAAVQPAAQSVTCGTALPNFTATGTITSKKAETVSYYWALSNGHQTTPATLTFAGPGTQAAAPYTITPTADPSSGAAVLVVTSPAAAASAPAAYALSCKEPPLKLAASATVSPAAKTLTSCTAAAPAFTFTGSITDNQPGTVSYHWSLPTGNGPLQTLQFPGAGTQTVSTAFTPASDSSTGSGSLVVTSPGSVTSSPAAFTLTCPNALKIDATGMSTTATIGQPYTGSFTVTGGNGHYTWNTTGLPSWLTPSANGATLTITGTPATPAANTVKVSVSDSSSADPSATASETVTVNATAMQLAGTLAAGTEDKGYSASAITVTGGYGAYTWATATGLPTGMTQSASGATLTIGGTPTEAGSFTVTVSVSDGESPAKSVTQSYTLTVSAPPPLTISTAALPAATIGVAYNASIDAAGGGGTLTWTAANLPSGLSLSTTTGTTAVISGTPGTATSSVTSRAAVAPAPVTLTVTDTAGQTVSKQFTLTVNPAPRLTISPASLPADTVGNRYSEQLTATGGSGSYTWSATSLPAGLTISSAGLISGTPTTANTSSDTSTITVVDNSNSTVKGTETLYIQIQNPIIQ